MPSPSRVPHSSDGAVLCPPDIPLPLPETQSDDDPSGHAHSRSRKSILSGDELTDFKLAKAIADEKADLADHQIPGVDKFADY